jgi:TolB protein
LSRFLAALLMISSACALFAQREPVLKQIEAPHPYYYREMYLPQLTTGPSAAAWMPDSKSLVYSMAGSLWKENLDSPVAHQLTAGPGYDYQPDCSQDARWVVYTSYQQDALELWALDLQSGQAHQLTRDGAVNVEPRFSPDGRRIVFASTSFHGRFHIFVGQFANGELTNLQRLTGENKSNLPRYYYSVFDHEISPAWSPDGNDIVFVSNRGHIYGTGGFWRMKADPGAEPREIHYEETAWKARPEFSPDGKRLVYSSYVGQAWNQLWLMPAEGGDPFPISYGDYDNTNPRWSPDGRQIAFISNRGGNTSLWVQKIPGGAQAEIVVKDRAYLKPMGRLSISISDETGKGTAARIFVTASDGRAYAPDNAWMHGDDSFVRTEHPFEAHYFHASGKSVITVPAGKIQIEVMRGFEYKVEKREVQVASDRPANIAIKLQPLQIPDQQHWVSADVHVHMNYGGIYRNTPQHLVQQAAAENLSIVEDLVVNKEQRIPDISYFRTTADPASTPSNLLLHSQEFHTSYWGHLGLLNLKHNFILPDYAAYAGTAAASLAPTNADVADMAHAQRGLVGYVHPFDTAPDPAKDKSLTDELPVDVALGKVDYIEALGFSDHKATMNVWYRLLNLGFHLPAAAGTDAMANFASLRGPVGLNRVYAEVPTGSLNIGSWLDALKRGRTFATNAPLLGFSIDGHPLGDEITLPSGANQLKFTAWLRSIVPIDHLQVVCNGEVVQDLQLNASRDAAEVTGSIPVSQPGWCLLRALSDKSEDPILDSYPYATTSPIYLTLDGKRPHSKSDAGYFAAWIDRLISAAQQHKDWNTDQERESVMDQLNRAKAVFVKLTL